MLAFSGLVAGSFALGAMAARQIDPAAITTARFVLAAALIGGLVLARPAGPRAPALRASWRYFVLGGLLAAYFVLMFEGLKTAAPVSTSAVFTLTPLLAGFFGWLLLRQRLSARTALGLAVGAAGALWVIFDADPAALLAFEIGRGEAIFFWGCVCHAAYIPLVAKLNRGESTVVFTFGTLVAGALLLLVWGAPALVATDWTALPGIVWITIAYVTVFATAATFLLAQFASLRLPASKVMAYTYLTPSWVILWQVALGHGAPGPLVLAGLGLTVLALLILLKQDPPAPDRPRRRRG